MVFILLILQILLNGLSYKEFLEIGRFLTGLTRFAGFTGLKKWFLSC